MRSLLIAGVIGFVTAAWADHLVYFVPFEYWQWKSKLWCLKKNPHCKNLNLKDKKIRQKLAWDLTRDSKILNKQGKD
jgi:hypothetical protein